MRRWRTLRYRIGEMRTFNRYLRRLSLAPSGAHSTTVILFGIPYGDWNEMLADAGLWRSLKSVHARCGVSRRSASCCRAGFRSALS